MAKDKTNENENESQVNVTDIEDILKPILDKVQDSVVAYLTDNVKPLIERVGTLEASVKNINEKPQNETSNANETNELSTLKARLNELETREKAAIEAREKAEAEQKRQSSLAKLSQSINEVLDKQPGLLQRDFLSKALYRELLEVAEDTDAGWVTKDGKKSATEYVTDYISGDIGKHFISVTVPNGGDTPRVVNGRQKQGTEASLESVVQSVKW